MLQENIELVHEFLFDFVFVDVEEDGLPLYKYARPPRMHAPSNILILSSARDVHKQRRRFLAEIAVWGLIFI